MSGGVHSLVTGLNGHGKTLYTVAEKLRPLVGTTIEYKDQQIERRLVIGGIRNLLLPHELMEVPAIDPETWKDEWRDHKREPGEPPHDVLCTAVNWWLWCMPGDVIVIDECQRLFRPMASGRRVPMFIEKLETARHYGVQFVYITQHPQLLHTNVRNLVGPHEHVRRIFGASRTVVYQWDHCTHPDRIKNATKRIWQHDKKAFGLYKSAEVHTSFKQRLPLAVWGLVLAAVLLVYLLWMLWGRMQDRFKGEQPSQTAAAPAGQASPAQAPAAVPGGAAGPAGLQNIAWPVVNVAAKVVDREPYSDRAVHLDGCWSAGDPLPKCLFGISINGRRLATVTTAQLLAAGYSWRLVAPCSGLLIFGERERPVTCDTPASKYEAPPMQATEAAGGPPGAAT